MIRFKIFKNKILTRAKEQGACKTEYARALKAQTFEELMDVIKDNFAWASTNKIIDETLIKEYRKEFNENDAFHCEVVCECGCFHFGKSDNCGAPGNRLPVAREYKKKTKHYVDKAFPCLLVAFPPLRSAAPCVLVIKIPGRKTYLNLNTMKNT